MNDEQSMVEIVAMAIYDGQRSRRFFTTRWDNLPLAVRDEWCGDARAAITAMREPTEAMVNRARDPRTANGSPLSKGLHDTWKAMIDAALQEQAP